MKPVAHRPSRRPASVFVASSLAAIALLAAATAAAQPGHTGGLAPLDDVPGLIATVSRADAPVAARARACQLLSLAGQRDAVPALAPLLADPALSHYARTALEGIPDPAALAALREALPKVPPAQRVGIINSLGVRADTLAAPALVAIAKDPAAPGAAEALIALAAIATPDASETIVGQLETGPAERRPAAAEAAIRLAEVLSKRGHAAQAVTLADKVRQSTAPAPFRLAGLRLAILARGADGLPLLLECLRGADRSAAAQGLRVARELPGPAVSMALAAEIPRLRPDLQAPLVNALADRGDRSIRGAIENLTTAPEAEVRLASVEALARLGDLSSVPVLVRVLGTTGPEAERIGDAAIASLVRLPARETDTALLEALRSAKPPTLARLMSVVAQRGTAGGTDTLLAHATASDADTARAAFDALGATAAPADLPRLIRASGTLSDPQTRDRAERALHAVALKNPEPVRRTEALAAGFRDASTPAARASLLQVLGMLGDASAAGAVAAAYADPAAEVRETAIQLLTHWSDTTAIPSLLGILKSTQDAKHRLAALQGIVTLAAPSEANASRTTPPSEQQVAWLKEASAVVRPAPEEKRALLSGLADLNCRVGLELLKPHLADPTVRAEAAEALLRLARRLAKAEDKAEARPLVSAVAAAETASAELKKKAAETLEALGK